MSNHRPSNLKSNRLTRIPPCPHIIQLNNFFTTSRIAVFRHAVFRHADILNFLTTFTTFTFFRKCNLLPPTTTSFDPQQHLRNCDIAFYPWGINLVGRWSKTIQYKNCTLLVPIPRINRSSCVPGQQCNTRLSSQTCIKVKKNMRLHQPLYTEGSTLKVLTYSKFTSKLKETLDKCGSDSWNFSGHSRRGGGTFALHCGVPSDYTKLQGDWKTNAYERYLDQLLQYKLQTVKRMCEVSLTDYSSSLFWGIWRVQSW